MSLCGIKGKNVGRQYLRKEVSQACYIVAKQFIKLYQNVTAMHGV